MKEYHDYCTCPQNNHEWVPGLLVQQQQPFTYSVQPHRLHVQYVNHSPDKYTGSNQVNYIIYLQNLCQLIKVMCCYPFLYTTYRNEKASTSAYTYTCVSTYYQKCWWLTKVCFLKNKNNKTTYFRQFRDTFVIYTIHSPLTIISQTHHFNNKIVLV